MPEIGASLFDKGAFWKLIYGASVFKKCIFKRLAYQ